MGCSNSKQIDLDVVTFTADITEQKISKAETTTSACELSFTEKTSSLLSTRAASFKNLFRVARDNSDRSLLREGGVDGDNANGNSTYKKKKRHRRRLNKIFAAPLSFTIGDVELLRESSGSGSLPFYPRTAEETEFLVEKLKNHYLFETLTESEFNMLTSAFETVEFPKLEKDKTLIEQGEVVNQKTAYFYIVCEGRCIYQVNGETVGEPAGPGDSFGDLALLYNCPRAATVKALTSESSVKLFRVHQTTFRSVLQFGTENADAKKIKLLEAVPYLSKVSSFELKKLASSMSPVVFEKGDMLTTRGDENIPWILIERGEILITNIITPGQFGEGNFDSKQTDACERFHDATLREGCCFGEVAILGAKRNPYDAIALSDGLAFKVEKDAFEAALQDHKKILVQAADEKKLKHVKAFSGIVKQGEARVFSYLASQFIDIEYPAGHELFQEGERWKCPAFYFVRSGKVILESTSGLKEIISPHFFFGEEQMFADVRRHSVSSYTATVIEDAVLGVLKLASCRRVLDRRRAGMHQTGNIFDSVVISKTPDLSVTNFDRLRILGKGNFGHVLLVTRVASDSRKHAYALKVLSKYQLVQNGLAKAAIKEREVMQQLHSPFISPLIGSFQDKDYLYLLMPAIRGGELLTIMYSPIVVEEDIKFYIACITEALAYLHFYGFVYRDLKPENVLLDRDGYPVLVDFGFTKFVTDKTYTLCGTPAYIAPEIILNRGHNRCADYWSLGILIYEMFEGETPFYYCGMDHSQVLRAIVKSDYQMPRNISEEAESIISGLLQKDPKKRLGNLAEGIDGISNHSWLATIDRDRLITKEIEAPYLPKVKDLEDEIDKNEGDAVSCEFEGKYPDLTESEQLLFAEF